MSPHSARRRRAGDFALIALVGSLGVLAPSASAQQPPTPVVVEPARRENIQERRWVTGELRPVRRAQVAAEEPGRVIELRVSEGQRIEEGELLARVDGRRLELELKQVRAEEAVAKATIEEEKASEEQARVDLESLLSLQERSASRPKEVSDAESALAISRARRLAAEAQLGVLDARAAVLEDRIADTEIRAPFAGRVLQKRTEVGQWLSEGEPVVEMLSDHKLEAWLAVPQQYVSAVTAEGVHFPIKIEATGQVYTSTDLRLVPLVDSSARNFALVANLDAGDDVLLAGMSIAAAVPTGTEADHLTVHPDAVLRGDVGPYVYVARPGGEDQPAQAMPVTVDVLFTQGGRVAVRSGGLREGDAVIVEGNERLFPMMPVAPSETAANAPGRKASER